MNGRFHQLLIQEEVEHMKLRRIIASFACLLVLVGNCLAIDLVVDGEKLELDGPPQVVEQRTLVPLRAIFEKLGATVEWDQATQTATATKGADEVRITIDSTTAYVNGQAQTLDAPAMAIDGRTLVPVRFVSEALQADVQWIQETQTVQITTQAGVTTVTVPTVTPTPTPTPTPAPVVSQEPATGHTTKTGKRNHYDPNCNGGTYYESTLEEALARGLTPCNKCVHD